jgi:hypothetical protein
MSVRTKLPVVVGLILLLAASAIAQDSYKLEYKFQKGKTYRYHAVSTGNMTQEMMGREMKMANGSNTTTRIAVENVLGDGNFVLVVSADSAVVTSKSQMMDTTLRLDNMIGKRTRVTMTKFGSVIARQVIDSLKMDERFAGGVQQGMTSTTRFPGHEVKMGEPWKDTFIDTVEAMGGKIYRRTAMEFTLAGKEDKQGHRCLKIDYSGTLSDTGKMTMGGMELYLEGGGKVKGSMYFDPVAGITVYDETTTDTDQTMAVTGQQNMTIPISQSMKTTRVLLGN